MAKDYITAEDVELYIDGRRIMGVARINFRESRTMDEKLKDKQAFASAVQAQDEKKVRPLEGIPDIHAAMKASGVACVREELEEAQKSEATSKDEKAKTKAREVVERSRDRRMICCCRCPGCGIGPMIYEDA